MKENPQLNYNPEAIKLFLSRHIEAEDGDEGYFNGESIFEEALETDKEGYLYHATKLVHLYSILDQGLMSRYGGIGGAGTTIASGEFEESDRGWLFASSIPDVVNCYTHEYDTFADENVENIPILLRFLERDEDDFIEDPAHDGAVRTRNNISVDRLYMLTYSGWVKLTDYRNDILSFIGMN
mgnify:CR=1 FL=1